VRRHRSRSTAISLRAQKFGRGLFAAIGFSSLQALAHFVGRRLFGDLANFANEIVGQWQARHRGAGFELPVKGIGDMAELYHLRHVLMIVACDAHVKPGRAGH